MAKSSAQPEASTSSAGSRLSHVRWLANLSLARKLALIVGIPSVVALAGSLLALDRVSATYKRSRTLEKANTASSYLIQAGATQAKERGFTAAALSDPEAKSARQAIQGLRQGGDALLNAALLESRGALRGNAVLSAALHQLQAARQNRDGKRQAVDVAFLGGQPINQELVQDWFDAQTRLILAERVFGATLFVAQNPYELVIQYNGYIKANVFLASEFAGRERARISRFIATNQPIPRERLDELQRWRGVVEENLAAIGQLRANPAMSAPVLHSIDNMERVFLGDYETARVAVYLASARHEPYPLTTDQWIKASTRGIDSILAVSERIGDEAARISHQQAIFSLANVLLIAGLGGLLLLAVVASVFVARHLTHRVAELRAAAERVTHGDYTQPISGAHTGDKGGDEFAKLAAVFNTMQGQVEAGIEQLLAEKAGVETKVMERTRELTVANERLLALNAEKDTFLGICSHDLKNPLSGIIGLAGLLQADAEDAAQVQDHAADILQSAEFMFHLVTNLLNIGAIEQGKFNLEPTRLNLATIVTRVAEAYRRRAVGKSICLDVSMPAAVWVHADARGVTQIIDNLVSNAVKFTPPGGTVEVVTEQLPGFSLARLVVRDTGPGLSEADQQRLFQKYARLSPQATNGESSTGLGLSIVQRLVEAMSGTVCCHTELGHGCAFVVELPASSPPSEESR